MTKSIMFLLLIVAICSLICSVLANLIRAAELRSIKRDLARFERSFLKDQRVRAIRKANREDRVELIVRDETKKDDLPKFGDE